MLLYFLSSRFSQTVDWNSLRSASATPANTKRARHWTERTRRLPIDNGYHTASLDLSRLALSLSLSLANIELRLGRLAFYFCLISVGETPSWSLPFVLFCLRRITQFGSAWLLETLEQERFSFCHRLDEITREKRIIRGKIALLGKKSAIIEIRRPLCISPKSWMLLLSRWLRTTTSVLDARRHSSLFPVSSIFFYLFVLFSTHPTSL